MFMRFRGGGVGHRSTRHATNFFKGDRDILDIERRGLVSPKPEEREDEGLSDEDMVINEEIDGVEVERDNDEEGEDEDGEQEDNEDEDEDEDEDEEDEDEGEDDDEDGEDDNEEEAEAEDQDGLMDEREALGFAAL
jgi:hypothetical protein